MKRSEKWWLLFCMLWFGGAADGLAATNEWTKATSGYWEEPDWSMGVLPSADQQAVAIRNAGWKAVAIGGNTTANYASSLTVNDLLIDAPTNSANQLLLNWAGVAVPLTVRSNLTIGSKGFLASHFSALSASNAYISGSVSFDDNSLALLGRVTLGADADGQIEVTNSWLGINDLTLGGGGHGVIQQSSAVVQLMNCYMPTNVPFSEYRLVSGTLLSSNLVIGLWDPATGGAFSQWGGVHTNANMILAASYAQVTNYALWSGMLVSDSILLAGGSFHEYSGTNYCRELQIGLSGSKGLYMLYGGQLVTSNTTVAAPSAYLSSSCSQEGGVHMVNNRLTLRGDSQYWLSAGTLIVSNVDMGPDTLFRLLGGTITNSGLFTMQSGARLWAGIVAVPGLGKLQITNAWSPATLDMNATNQWPPPVGPTTLHFQDSHDVPWSGSLQIWNWSQSANPQGYGPDHIFIGTNSAGLTSSQLSAITFVSPGGWPAGSYAASLLPNGELVPLEYTYTVTTSGTVTITGYRGPGGSITIPSTIGGLPVTAIGGYAFYYSSTLTNVVIPNSVRDIGYYAFYNDSQLKSVVIPNTVTNIGYAAFEYCPLLANVTLPNSMTVIPPYLLYGASALGAISIPYGITNIGSYAFAYTGLTNVALSSSVAIISEGAFYTASQLKTITLPNSVTNIGAYVFAYTGLTNITVPGSVLTIGSSAFYFCQQLVNATLTNPVATIASSLFYYCTNLTTIAIPDSVKTIQSYAFYNDLNLTNIVIGSGVTNIDSTALGNTLRLISISVNPQNGTYSSQDGVLFNRLRTTLLQYPLGRPGAYTVPATVLEIANDGFSGAGRLTAIAMPNGLATIGYSAFNNCTNLAYAVLPDSVTSAGNACFSYCTALTNAILGNGLLAVAQQMFAGCSSLANAVLGNKIATIGFAAFSQCGNLRSVTIPQNVTNISDQAFSQCTRLANINLTNGLKTIGYSAFYFCTNLASVHIPDTVTSLGYQAFSYCSNLVDLTLGSGLMVISDNAFYCCAGLPALTLPPNIRQVGSYAFANCTRLATITAGRGLTSIGYYAFSNCRALVAVRFEGNEPDGDYPDVFYNSPFVIVYYMPGTIGWGSTFASRPATPWMLPYPAILNFGSSFGITSNGFGFIISWATNIAVVVETSTNLTGQHWSAISTNPLVNGWHYFADPESKNRPMRFYRVRSP